MNQFDKIDDLIVKAVQKSLRSPLYDRDVYTEAERLRAGTGRVCSMSIIDGRLTALKKAGKIKFCKKTRLWVIETKP